MELRTPYAIDWDVSEDRKVWSFKVTYNGEALETYDTWDKAKEFVKLHAMFYRNGSYNPVRCDSLGLLRFE